MTENLINNQERKEMDIPVKFLDKEGNINIPALVNSYKELERKVGDMVRIPTEKDPDEIKQAFYKKIGVPEKADAYKLEIKNELLTADPEVNEKLRTLGFTNRQVQAVYDLAAEKVLPVIKDLAQEYEAQQQKRALEDHFGGAERFQEIAHQVNAWAKQNLSQEVFDALSTTYEGVITLYNMMQTGEPVLLDKVENNREVLDEEGLKKLMMSPKYWREQDPLTLKKVSDGFNRLYPKVSR